ncbi:MAG: hypothetical protein A3K77_00860 [Euryarchaeota archaeon RBG_13_31_8]|nr:MAG: hypothetical protein A3K77_00860 [Euryarchaeota archaeon RBG_13_31_8]
MKIQFLTDTSKFKINNYPKNTLVIFRDEFGYSLPSLQGVEFIEFLEYKKKYTLFDPELFIIIGLNRIITPSNRCDMVHEYLHTITPNIKKISIDTEPFIGEPWRLWFHYSITHSGNFNINYSYIIEGEWQYWFYRNRQDCRLSQDNIRLFITDTISDLELYKTSFEFFDISAMEETWYSKTKEFIFSKYDTPKLLINNLLKLSNKYFNIDISYDSYKENKIIKLPDIGIYRFIVEENKRRMGIYNEVIKYGNESLYKQDSNTSH